MYIGPMQKGEYVQRSRTSTRREWERRRRFEHWYLDNQVYFITARVRDRQRAFASDEAKEVFWRQFDRYTQEFGFVPWVTSVLDNHYHTVGYLRVGANLGRMMQRLHGSVAKLVNDVIEGMPAEAGTPNGTRIVPFWRESGHQNYFDGCLRDGKQGRLTWRYVFYQCRRHGICCDPLDYPHTRVRVEAERAVARAEELGAFLEGVAYPRYLRGR